jgi:hypothetical protein
MASWPSTLPQVPLVRDYSEQSPDLTIRSTVDTGPAKVRRRATSGVTVLTCTFRLSLSQRDTLDSFWKTTLKGGSIAFTWNHPITSSSITCRIVNPPTYTPLVRGSFWNTTLKIEILP